MFTEFKSALEFDYFWEQILLPKINQYLNSFITKYFDLLKSKYETLLRQDFIKLRDIF